MYNEATPQLRLVLSVRKTWFLASSQLVADGLVWMWRPRRFARKHVARSLGLDWSVGRVRRTPTVQRRLRTCFRLLVKVRRSKFLFIRPRCFQPNTGWPGIES